jgi:ABC-type bacteriocin/lantibiotic exporter with double-glycine peptidase domain
MPDTAHVATPLPRTFQRLLGQALLGERALLGELAALALFGALLGLGSSMVARLVIDDALQQTAPRLLLVLTAATVCVGGHQAWAGWMQDRTATELGVRLEQGALSHLIGALLDSDLALLRRRDAGWMGETLGGASGVVHAYVGGFVSLVVQSFLALASLGVLIAASPLATLAVVLASGALVALSAGFLRWETALARLALDAASKQRERLAGLVSNLVAVRGLFATDRLGAAWSKALRDAVRSATRRTEAATLRAVITSGGTRILGVGITVWGVYRTVDSQLGVGEMLFITSVSAGLAGSILAIGNSWLGYVSLAPQFERVNELLAAAPLAPATREPVQPTDAELVVEGVWFRYSEETRWVLRDQSWRVRRGQHVRVQSPSGSGKSTLLRLLAGLLVPARGAIRVFGHDPRRARELVLYVPQHCELFEASIGDNLRLLSNGAESDELERVALQTGLCTLLAQLPMGLETPVAARGQNLSSGQRQLIVLTAAFASRRPVILLDEALSQLDAAARRRIDWASLSKERTIVSVEHAEQS